MEILVVGGDEKTKPNKANLFVLRAAYCEEELKKQSQFVGLWRESLNVRDGLDNLVEIRLSSVVEQGHTEISDWRSNYD